MAAFFPEIGCKGMINQLLTTLNVSGDVKVHLYSNNHTPAFTDTLGNYTETTFPGYAAINITDWQVGADVSSLRVQCIAATAKTFTYTGGGSPPYTIYGYYIQSTTYGLLFAELATGGPFSISVTGQQLVITPLIEVGNC